MILLLFGSEDKRPCWRGESVMLHGGTHSRTREKRWSGFGNHARTTGP